MKYLLIFPAIKLGFFSLGMPLGYSNGSISFPLPVFFTLPVRLTGLYFCGLRYRNALLKMQMGIGRDIFPHCCIFRFSLAPVKFLASWAHSTGRAPGGHVLTCIFDRWGNTGLASQLADITQLDLEPDAVTTVWCSVYSRMLLEDRTQPDRDRWKDNSKSVKGFQGGWWGGQ